MSDEELETFKKVLEIMDDGVLEHVSEALHREDNVSFTGQYHG